MVAILAVFVLAILVEGSSTLRRFIMKKFLQYVSSRVRNHRGKATLLAWWQRVGIPTLHASQALLGYLLMLATMTFALEFLLAVVIGLGVGHALFTQKNELASATHAVSANPCCQFLIDDARDEQQQGGLTSLETTTATSIHHSRHGEVSQWPQSQTDTAPLLPPGGGNHHVL
jgi:hypothetical protein